MKNLNSIPGADGRAAGAHPDEDLLLDLAHGLLAAEPADAVLGHLAACAPCEDRFRLFAGDVERARAGAADAAADLPPVVQAARAPAGSRAGWFTRTRAAWSLGAAAAAVAAIVIVTSVIRTGAPGGTSHASLGWLPDADELMVTRNPGSSAADAALAEGLAAYARRDMAGAATLLAEVHASGPMADMAQIYYGSSLAWTGQYAEAVHHLSEVDPDLLPEPWRGETRWTLYVSLRETGAKARAESLLTVIAAGRGAPAERARDALGGR